MKLASLAMISLLVCGVAFAAQSESAAASESGEIAELHKACDGGVATSCHNLGVHYFHGEGVNLDLKIAAVFFQRACDGGEVLGCEGLGHLYARRQDNKLAARFYRKACDGGVMTSCGALGGVYEIGNGVTQNYSMAAELYDKACDGGVASACFNLGVMYALGKGVETDYKKASQLREKSYSLPSAEKSVNDKVNSALETPQQKQDDATCKSYGAEFGSDKYVSCRIQLEALHQATSASKLENNRAQTEQINQRQKGIDTMSCTDRANAYMNGKQLPAVSASTAILSGLMVNMDRQRIFSDCMKALGW